VLLLQPSEFLRRLATLVPPPRAHLVRYHGVFAPASLRRGLCRVFGPRRRGQHQLRPGPGRSLKGPSPVVEPDPRARCRVRAVRRL